MTAVEALRLFATELGLLFAEMAPYLLLGFLLAGAHINQSLKLHSDK